MRASRACIAMPRLPACEDEDGTWKDVGRSKLAAIIRSPALGTLLLRTPSEPHGSSLLQDGMTQDHLGSKNIEPLLTILPFGECVPGGAQDGACVSANITI